MARGNRSDFYYMRSMAYDLGDEKQQLQDRLNALKAQERALLQQLEDAQDRTDALFCRRHPVPLADGIAAPSGLYLRQRNSTLVVVMDNVAQTGDAPDPPAADPAEDSEMNGGE